MEKKAKGWMAMRGSWGRKKRSDGVQVRGYEDATPFHDSLRTDMDYPGLRGINEPHRILTWGNVSKRDIPIIDERDIEEFDRHAGFSG